MFLLILKIELSCLLSEKPVEGMNVNDLKSERVNN